MMMNENQTIEYKSIRKIRTGDNGFRDLSVTCVALANAQGGTIYVGYEDKTKEPLPDQHVDIKEINDTLSRLRGLCFNVGISSSEVEKHPNGGEFFELYIAPSLKSIATTSDAKIYMRIGDKCEPVRNEEIQRLSIEKGAYQWEVLPTSVDYKDIPQDNIKKFVQDIRESDRVKAHVKQMSDEEIIEHYNLFDGKRVTNLGVLWLGTASQRSRISYPITVQYIVYNNLEQKVRKEEWHDNSLNPKELLIDIERTATELNYAYEIPDGLFRKQIRHYHPKVIRELLLNAFAHHCFTISNDIMICVFPDRMEISSPGGLPLGITKDNILHQRHRRNPHFTTIMSDLKLMEGEGSGYDLIYEITSMDSKRPPIIESSFNETKVIVYSEIQNADIIPLLDYTQRNYSLSQKNFIAFGAIANAEKIRSIDLTEYLQLSDEERLRSYIGNLLKDEIILKDGRGKGSFYKINPRLISNSKVNKKTTLKTIEPYRLKALILEDLKNHPMSMIDEVAYRLPDVDLNELKKMVRKMATNGEINHDNSRRYRRYYL